MSIASNPHDGVTCLTSDAPDEIEDVQRNIFSECGRALSRIEGNFVSDGELKSLDIPLEYFSNAKTVKPTHLVIVCSASKYGDFFEGGRGSTMYVDDFELVYE